MKRNMFTPEQEKWLQALESGGYLQCQEQLCDVVEGSEDKSYCCLGVANVVCDLRETDMETLQNTFDKLLLRNEFGTLHTPVPKFEDEDEDDCYTDLTELNDSQQWPFARIAAFIRANPWQVFTNFDVPEQSE